VSGIKPVIDFGWMMSAGLAVTFVTSFLLFPTLLMVMKKTGSKDSHKNVRFMDKLVVNQNQNLFQTQQELEVLEDHMKQAFSPKTCRKLHNLVRMPTL